MDSQLSKLTMGNTKKHTESNNYYFNKYTREIGGESFQTTKGYQEQMKLQQATYILYCKGTTRHGNVHKY